jgi:hypothetical protein
MVSHTKACGICDIHPSASRAGRGSARSAGQCASPKALRARKAKLDLGVALLH